MTDLALAPRIEPRQTYFVLPEGTRTPVDAGDFFDWLYWSMHHPFKCRVTATRLGPYYISTVFWGIAEYGPDKLFETMIFEGDTKIDATYERELAVLRCATWDEAERQHQDAIAWLQEQLEVASTCNAMV